VAERNWAGNVDYTPARIHQPTSVEELAAIVAAAPKIHVLGTRHSFNAIADSTELVSLRRLPAEIDVDRGARTVTCPAAMTYGALAGALRADGLALANLGSLPHVSVAGAVSTATHGSGERLGNLATSVAAIELVTSAGERITRRRGDPDFNGIVVGLGALGAVTRVTLDVEPSYEVTQHVYERLSWDALEAHFDEIAAAGDSVGVFTRWDDVAGSVWVKRRTDTSRGPAGAELFGAPAAVRQMHPIPGGDPDACTPQLGVPGPWSERLPHFRLEFTPSAGEELQSEYLFPRAHALEAFAAVRTFAPRIRPLLHIGELRTVAADRLWMSPQYERDTVAIHFTWRRDQPAVERLLAELEPALAPFAPRPHWGKVFVMGADALASSYPRRDDFIALAARLDPRGAFRNAWLERCLGR
jgi:alditol oxidase